MLLHIPAVLSAEAVMQIGARLAIASWNNGRVTAGNQSGAVKHNLQLPEEDVETKALSELVLRALDHSSHFISAALPARVYPPLFNKYIPGMGFGPHIDNAIRSVTGTRHRIRTDISATLFLSAPETYDGGELVVEGTYGTQSVKFAAGDMVLYPATSLHQVMPVTRGERLAAFFWVQSMIHDDAERTMLFQLDSSIQSLGASLGVNHPDVLRLTGLYHNMVRKWGVL
jgi:PKHD-type hydroxylase